MMAEIYEKYRVLERKIAARSGKNKGKSFRSKKQIIKDLERYSKEFKDLRKTLLKLKADQAKLEKTIEQVEERFDFSKEKVIGLNDALKDLSLVDSNKVVFYSNDCSDIGYVIDGEEYYVDDSGEKTLMKEYRREQRAKQRDNLSESNEDDEDDKEDEDEDEDCLDCKDFSNIDDQPIDIPNIEEGEDFKPYRFWE